jgi:hypothetical protein
MRCPVRLAFGRTNGNGFAAMTCVRYRVSHPASLLYAACGILCAAVPLVQRALSETAHSTVLHSTDYTQ